MTISRVVTAARTSLTMASLPAHCQTPGCCQALGCCQAPGCKSYRKRKAAVSCEILPRTRSVAPGCRCSGLDHSSTGYWTTSDHMPWRHVTSTPTAQKCVGISRNVPVKAARRPGGRAPHCARSGRYVFKDIVQHYLQQIRFEEDKYARMIGLPQFGGANVVLDPSITGHNGLLALSESAW